MQLPAKWPYELAQSALIRRVNVFVVGSDLELVWLPGSEQDRALSMEEILSHLTVLPFFPDRRETVDNFFLFFSRKNAPQSESFRVCYRSTDVVRVHSTVISKRLIELMHSMLFIRPAINSCSLGIVDLQRIGLACESAAP